LRLVSEALAAEPEAEEIAELRLVEAGARRDLGEDAAARLVLEAELGERTAPDALAGADAARLRIASAYADLLHDLGEQESATEWLTAIAAADPEDLVGAVGRLGIEFTELDGFEGDEQVPEGDEQVPEGDEQVPEGEDIADAADLSELEDTLAQQSGNAGASFDADVEAEVAELLGEVEPPPGDDTALR
jgi:hypothetical protein